MVYITAMLVVHSSIQIALIIDIFLGGSSKDQANDWFDINSSGVVVGIYIGFVVFDAIALSLILQLLHFHWLLHKEGLTTYKYIVRETQRKREKTNKEEARKNQRMVAMGKANDEGKLWLAIRLRYGEMCSCCDPLPPLEEERKEEGNQQQPTYTPVYRETSESCDDGDAVNGNDEHVNGNSANQTNSENGSDDNNNNNVTFINVSNELSA